jgi:hypothetical protein
MTIRFPLIRHVLVLNQGSASFLLHAVLVHARLLRSARLITVMLSVLRPCLLRIVEAALCVVLVPIVLVSRPLSRRYKRLSKFHHNYNMYL